MKRQFDPSTGQWSQRDDVSVREIADAVYEDVGQRFRIEWKDGLPIIDFNNLPDDVSEQEVRDAIRNNVPQNR